MATRDADDVFVDTNVLLTATTPSREHHARALSVLDNWPNAGLRLCTSSQVVREFLVVATRPCSENGLGLSPADALVNARNILARMRRLEENAPALDGLLRLVAAHACSGKAIHDTNIVATMLAHGVKCLVTANADDFRRYGSRIEILDLAEVAQ